MVSAERIKTNHMLFDDLGLWDEFRINKTRDSNETQKYYNIISKLIDQQLNAGRKWLATTDAKQYFFGEAQYQQEVFQSLENEWNNILKGNYDSVDELIEEVYRQGKLKGYNDIQSRIIFTDTDSQALNFLRQYNFQLIQKLNDDLRANVKNTIIEGVATGENPYNLANKITSLGVTHLPGSTLTPKQRAVMIAKTEVSRAQNTGILQSYANEGYTEVKILTSEDNNICRLCLENAYLFNDGDVKVYSEGLSERVHRISDMDGNSWVPLHPNCRCTYILVWESRKDNVVKPYTVNLTPFYDLSKLNNISQVYLPLNEKDIPSFIPRFMHDRMLELDEKVENATMEYGYLANLISKEVGEIVKDNEEDTVDISNSIIKFSEGDEIVASHIHTSRQPFNYKDFDSFLNPKQKLYPKYMIVHTNEDVFIAEFDKKAFNHKKEILNEIIEEYGAGHFGIGAIHNNIWNNYINNKILNKYITFTRIRK